MSNRLTFSLASLVLVLAVALCLPVDAAEINDNVAAVAGMVTVPSKGFAVIARNVTDPPTSATDPHSGIRIPDDVASGNNYEVAIVMPDLAEFLAMRGTITLLGPNRAAPAVDPAPKDLVISEIMWARDGDDASTDKQWIELYNATNADIEVILEPVDPEFDPATDWTLVFTPGRPVPTTGNELSGSEEGDPAAKVPNRNGMIVVDQLSNAGVNIWSIDDRGQSGNTTPSDNAKPIISMYRDINYDKIETELGKDTLNRGERNKGIPNGHAGGSWKQSNSINVFAELHIGTPGAKHFKPVASLGTTTVPRDTVIITEVGNSSDDLYDWIELVALKDTNLEKYELQVVKDGNTNNDSIVVLAQFEKRTLKAGEILLVLNSDPTKDDHPIAAGRPWGVADTERDPTGTDSVYWVDSRLKIPDGGKLLFIVRKERGKKNHEHIVDLAGNRFEQNLSAAYSTNLWPLREAGAGHGNVIDGDVEDFNSRTNSYQRNDRSGGIGEKDWSVRGFTGIGYKRHISDLGGTPGFDKDSLKEKSTDLADANVTISEIMYQTGRNVPQWIELYNSSSTQGVNLNEWKLKFETNRDDAGVDIRTPAVTIQFGGTLIPPNQTVLLVSTSTNQATDEIDVDHRIIDLWDTEKDELEVKDVGHRYQLLSTTAFKLTLTEKGGMVVDTVGNLGAASAWDLPMDAELDGRSSIIRRYDDGVARDGTMANGWALASETGLPYEVTYYGHRDDIGTPGYRGGGALPVSLSKFRPERLETGEIVVRWITESELNNAGFNILRSEARDGEFTQLNTKLIAGHGTTSERHTYEYADTSAKPNVVYYYQIQDVSLEGQVNTLATTHLRGNVSAAGKLTTTWGELKALQ